MTFRSQVLNSILIGLFVQIAFAHLKQPYGQVQCNLKVLHRYDVLGMLEQVDKIHMMVGGRIPRAFQHDEEQSWDLQKKDLHHKFEEEASLKLEDHKLHMKERMHQRMFEERWSPLKVLFLQREQVQECIHN